jgi:hypothetical protein
LTQFGVDFVGVEAMEGLIALKAARELEENGGGEGYFGCGVEVDDSFEGSGTSLLCRGLFPED